MLAQYAEHYTIKPVIVSQITTGDNFDFDGIFLLDLDVSII